MEDDIILCTQLSFVSLFPIKIYENYFREKIDADQCNYCLPQQCTHKATRYRLDIQG